MMKDNNEAYLSFAAGRWNMEHGREKYHCDFDNNQPSC